MDDKVSANLAPIAQAARSSRLVDAFIKLDIEQQCQLISYTELLVRHQTKSLAAEASSPAP